MRSGYCEENHMISNKNNYDACVVQQASKNTTVYNNSTVNSMSNSTANHTAMTAHTVTMGAGSTGNELS